MIAKFMPILAILCSGCASTAAVRDIESLNDSTRRIREINGQLQDYAQTMVYAGRINNGEIADMALNAAIAILGEPDATERLVAANLTPDDVQRILGHSIELQKEKSKLVSVTDDTMLRLRKSVPKLAASHNFLFKLGGFAVVFILLFSVSRLFGFF